MKSLLRWLRQPLLLLATDFILKAFKSCALLRRVLRAENFHVA